MEKELVDLVKVAIKASEATGTEAEGGGRQEDQERDCVEALKRLKSFPVTPQLLVSSQVGRDLRRLAKHPRKKIHAFASDLVQVWRQLILEDSNRTKAKENGTAGHDYSVKVDAVSVDTTRDSKVQKVSCVQVQETEVVKVRKTEHNGTPGSRKVSRFDDIPNKEVANGNLGRSNKVKKAASEEQEASDIKALPSYPARQGISAPLAKCNDPLRDKVRGLLFEALSKVSREADITMANQVNACDPAQVTASVESAMFAKWGRMNGPHKNHYRSIMFNIKDANNPDFRRKVLLGDIKPQRLLEMNTEEMASDKRQLENKQIKEKALFDCELGAGPKATTDQFTCSRCGQKKCTYYQMQTRSADEPMTTYVTCVNCNNHWKFC